MRATLLILLVACGGGSSAAPPDASSDAAVGEICNGIDDTGDGIVDEECPCMPFDVTVAGSIRYPDIVWAGDRYFVVTQDTGTLAVAPVIDGTVGAPFVVGSVPTTPAVHDLAWNGSTLAIVIRAANIDSTLALFDHDGAELGRQTLPTTAYWLRVAWVGDRFLVTGQSTQNTATLVLAEYSATGALLYGPFEIAGLYNLTSVSAVAFSATQYVIGASRTGASVAYTVDRTTHAGSLRELDLGNQFSQPSAAYAGGVFAVSASGNTVAAFPRGDRLQFLDGAGAPTSFNALPYTSLVSTLTAQGGTFTSIALLEDTSTNRQYAAMQFDTIGDPLAAPLLPIASLPAGSGYTDLDATSAADRFAFSHGYQGLVRVIQHCW
jgi:hypothetical protein